MSVDIIFKSHCMLIVEYI